MIASNAIRSKEFPISDAAKAQSRIRAKATADTAVVEGVAGGECVTNLSSSHRQIIEFIYYHERVDRSGRRDRRHLAQHRKDANVLCPPASGMGCPLSRNSESARTEKSTRLSRTGGKQDRKYYCSHIQL
jgi:hypothetical protein